MRQLLVLYILTVMTGCGVAKSSFSPNKKYAPAVLQKDYAVYRQTLEEAHPGIYWYTSKDSMDHYFDWGFQQLKDSLTEPEFRKVLSYVTAKINCGHTSVRASKSFSKYQDTTRLGRVFPLSLKLWQDTTVVAANLNRRDSILKRGTIITAINGQPMDRIVDTLFSYIGTDGYNRTNKYQILSNRGYFGSLYSSLFGYSPLYRISFIDSAGRAGTTTIRPYYPGADTLFRSQVLSARRLPQPSRKERKEMQKNSVRLLKLDTANHVAMMDLNSFGRGFGLKGFFRRSFRALRKNNIRGSTLGLAGTVLLGAVFLMTTAREWYHLIGGVGLTVRTNLFGTTFYSLVGLHASHVVIGLIMLTVALTLALTGRVKETHAERLDVLSFYWHFVDGVWIVVFTDVYLLGR